MEVCMEEKKDFENTDKTLNMLRNAFRLTGDINIFMQITALEKEKENIKNKSLEENEDIISEENDTINL